ncbi:MAG TPA: orotidine-5'-phosphate decarboxylase [Polyangiaceae bacterium]|nr:orotidine-5'-phosphate decarboxylase [Polyangiaceae bacterium]
MTPSPRAIERLCLPLDAPDLEQAVALAERVGDAVGVLKIGLELFVSEGPRAVERIKRFGRKIFLDLKLHDIPETVAGAVRSAERLGVDYLTVHAAGAEPMLRAARAAVSGSLQLLGVTVLTSLDDADLRAVGVSCEPQQQVLRLGSLATNAGLSGLVCSTQELESLRAELGGEPILVVPGIRPASAAVGDQKRVGTPGRAIALGADLLVVGRPIRDARDPRAAALAIAEEIDEALLLQ